MTDQAATPSGGAEVSARPADSQPSTTERLKAAIFGSPEPQPDPERAPPRQEVKAEPEAESAEKVEPEAAEAPEPAESEEAEPSFSDVNELAEALGWDVSKLLDLEAPTKIDGKEGKARLRDLLKSYQLEGHLNQKLIAHADEKKAFESEASRKVQEINERTQHLNSAFQLAEKLLHAEFASTDWDALRAQDPLTYNSKVVEFQDRQRNIQALADMLGQEKQRTEAEAAKQQQAYFQEQMRLLESKVPEWASQQSREKALGEMAPTFEEAYGITKAEIGGVTDHRYLLLARDAYQWRKLQQAKPAVLNKVKTAPKLLKPGTPQSRAAQENLQSNQDRSRLRSTGKVRDAIPLLKRQLFS